MWYIMQLLLYNKDLTIHVQNVHSSFRVTTLVVTPMLLATFRDISVPSKVTLTNQHMV